MEDSAFNIVRYICLAEDILDQSLSGLFVVSGGVSPFPASVFPLSDVAFPVCPFLCHVCASFSSVAQTTTTKGAQSLLIFSEDRNIFQPLSCMPEISILCLLQRSFCACRLPFLSSTSFQLALYASGHDLPDYILPTARRIQVLPPLERALTGRTSKSADVPPGGERPHFCFFGQISTCLFWPFSFFQLFQFFQNKVFSYAAFQYLF